LIVIFIKFSKYVCSNSSKEEEASTTTELMDDEQLQKRLLEIKSKSHEEGLVVSEEKSTTDEAPTINIDEKSQVPHKLDISDNGDNSLMEIDEKSVDNSDQVKREDKEKDKQIIIEEIVKQKDENVNQSKMNETLDMDQSNVSMNMNDQSETETETADEQIDCEMTEEGEGDSKEDKVTVCEKLVKVKTEELDEKAKKKDTFRQFSSLKGLPNLLSVDGLTQSEIVARFELLVEVERVESEVEKRMKELNAQLDGTF